MKPNLFQLSDYKILTNKNIEPILDSIVNRRVTVDRDGLGTPKKIVNKSTNLKIGELAKQTGLAVGTLRYYSDLGLLHPVARGDNGYRYYSQNASKQVEFIKKAQAIGFTLEEIKTILDVRDRGERPCSLVQGLLDNKIEQLEIQIKKMSLFKQELEEYRTSWINNPNPESDSQEVCPLISSVTLDATA